MLKLLAISTVVFAAFSIWLAVRIVNRRERWAKWTAAGLLCLLAAYPLSLGPACWWFPQEPDFMWIGCSPFPQMAPRIYWPLGWLAQHGSRPVPDVIRWYVTPRQGRLILPAGIKPDPKTNPLDGGDYIVLAR